jgi:hypothetical protein
MRGNVDLDLPFGRSYMTCLINRSDPLAGDPALSTGGL